jgi:hypothetical protein
MDVREFTQNRPADVWTDCNCVWYNGLLNTAHVDIYPLSKPTGQVMHLLV